MDVWLHGGALVALWVIAVLLAVIALLGFAIWLRVVEVAKVVAPRPAPRTATSIAAGLDTAKGPSHPEG